jgi:hypothetical protein
MTLAEMWPSRYDAAVNEIVRTITTGVMLTGIMITTMITGASPAGGMGSV